MVHNNFILASIKSLENKCEKINTNVRGLTNIINRIYNSDNHNDPNTNKIGFELFKEECIQVYEEEKKNLTEDINLWLRMRKIERIMTEEINSQWLDLKQEERDKYTINLVKKMPSIKETDL